MEEIDLTQLFNYFKSKWIYILLAVSLAFCLSSIYATRLRDLEYTSSTTILLNQASDQLDNSDISLNNSLVSTYSEIIKSKRVLRQVINDLALEYSYEELAGKISVGAVSDTQIIRISVTDTNNVLAADIANSIAQAFSREIVELYNLENVNIIDEAEVSESSSSMSNVKIVAIGVIAGGIISVAIIFVLFYFDTTVKSEDDITRITGLPVIGIIPLSRDRIKKSEHREYYGKVAKKGGIRDNRPVLSEVKKLEATEDNIADDEIGISYVTVSENIKEFAEELNLMNDDSLSEEDLDSSEKKEKDDEVLVVKQAKKRRRRTNSKGTASTRRKTTNK